MYEKPWYEMRNGRAPRLWLALPEGNLLISWETIRKIRATPDFLNLVFECEYGIITICSAEPLRELYEMMQMEMVRKIDGIRLTVKLAEITAS